MKRIHQRRYFQPEPLRAWVARSDLIQRMRLLWQGRCHRPNAPLTAGALRHIMAGLGLTAAEQEEVLGTETFNSLITGDLHHV